jgi:hypothetical protein
MANTINFIPNGENWTLEYNSIEKDYAFNDLQPYFETVNDRFYYLTERNRDRKQYRLDTQTDNISIEGVPFAGTAHELAGLIDPIING